MLTDVNQSNSESNFMAHDDIEKLADDIFDRDVTFEEAFVKSTGQEFVRRLAELLNRDFLILGRNGEIMTIARPANKPLVLALPQAGALPIHWVHIKAKDGVAGSVCIPIIHEGNAFALMVVEEDALREEMLFNKLKNAADMIGWYIHVIYQRRMISELHIQTQKTGYDELLLEHERVMESEKRYRELAENLDQRVKERKAELEKVQRQLIQQEKMASIGQLAAGVAHEINNPTGFVHSNLQTLKIYHANICEALKTSRNILESGNIPEHDKFLERWKELDMDFLLDDVPELIDESLKGTERIARIVKSMSRFSHVDQNELESVNINELLDATLELLGNEIKYKAELIKNYGVLPMIKCNSNRLHQVFVNIIVNALHAIEKGGTVTIVTRPVDFGIEIQFKDSGKGISPENLSQVFNPFFSTKPVGHGTGLGLSISYEIITGSGGEISVESEPGKGTTFFVRLPIEPVKE